MGLVQSEADDEQETFEVEGLTFGIESSLRRFIPIYGKLVVDFRQSFWGEGFQVSFSGQSAC